MFKTAVLFEIKRNATLGKNETGEGLKLANGIRHVWRVGKGLFSVIL